MIDAEGSHRAQTFQENTYTNVRRKKNCPLGRIMPVRPNKSKSECPFSI
jgi:hypothetical protein